MRQSRPLAKLEAGFGNNSRRETRPALEHELAGRGERREASAAAPNSARRSQRITRPENSTKRERRATRPAPASTARSRPPSVEAVSSATGRFPTAPLMRMTSKLSPPAGPAARSPRTALAFTTRDPRTRRGAGDERLVVLEP